MRMWMVLGLVVLSGCAAVGPDYEKPVTTHREAFVSVSDAADPVVTAWWETFGDPILDELIAEALAGNLDLAAARARVREARAIRRVASGRFLPNVDARGSYQRQRASENGVINLGTLSDQGLAELETGLFDVGFDASWEIDVFGSVRRENESAEARLEAAEEARRGVLISVLAEVGSAYIELRGSERLLAVVERNIAIQRETLELVSNKFKVGLVPELDVQQATAQLQTTQAAAPPIRASVQSAMFRLAVLLGQQPGALRERLDRTAELVVRGESVPVGLPSELLMRRPDVREAERLLHAATAEVGVATAELYPRFFITGAAGFESVDFADLFSASSRTFSIGPTIRWPLFRGGALRANVAAREARVDAALAGFQQSVLLAVEDVERSLVVYAEEELRRRALADALVSSRRSVELAETLYEKGLSEFLPVLDAERRLLEADERLVLSEVAVSQELIRLYKALGGGWEAFEPAVAMSDRGDEGGADVVTP